MNLRIAVFKKCTEIELIDKVVGALVKEKVVDGQGRGNLTKILRCQYYY